MQLDVLSMELSGLLATPTRSPSPSPTDGSCSADVYRPRLSLISFTDIVFLWAEIGRESSVGVGLGPPLLRSSTLIVGRCLQGEREFVYQ